MARTKEHSESQAKKRALLIGALEYLKANDIPLVRLYQIADLAGLNPRTISQSPYADIRMAAYEYKAKSDNWRTVLRNANEDKLHRALTEVLSKKPVTEISFRGLCEKVGIRLSTDGRKYPRVLKRLENAFGRKEIEPSRKVSKPARPAQLPKLAMIPVTHEAPVAPESLPTPAPMIMTLKERIRKMSWAEYMEYRA